MLWSVSLFLVIVPDVVTYTCTVDPVDVVFVLDSSGSMGSVGFQLELDFVKQFTNLVQIGAEEFHIGVVQFDNDGFIEFGLTTYFDKTSIINAVQTIHYLRGGTSISSGLSTAKDVLDQTKRSSAVKYVVLLTDGDFSSDRDAAVSIANNLKSDSALRIFIIGIGVAIPTDDMKQIASSPSYFLHVNQAAELAAVATTTVNITCQDIKDCAHSPCQNGGTCETTQSGYTCKCSFGYIGVRCQDYDECISNPCFNNGTCYQGRDVYYCMCVPGYIGARCETNYDECSSNPCKNGATCIDRVNGYNCHCVPGYVGVNCETDYDECASSPCRNGGTCVDFVNFFQCRCPYGFYEDLCETGICHPQPADMIFLLDSSVSQTEQNFMNQLHFVSNFTDHVLIGPNDTQLSVITFSSEALVEFDLNTYDNKTTVNAAIQSIKFRPGITRTDKALQKAYEIAASARKRRRPNGKMARVFVFVITDGMSTYREKTKYEANYLKKLNPEGIATIGIGEQVSHQELRDIATSSSNSPNVFSVDNFDSLYTIVTQLVHVTCKECSHSAVSDVILMIDESVNTSNIESLNSFAGLRDSASKPIRLMDTIGSENNDTHVSLTSFSNTVRTHVHFSDYLSRLELLLNISKITHKENVISNISSALYYANMHGFNETNGGRLEARKFFVIFTNGGFNLDPIFELEKKRSHENKIKIITVGFGSNINVDDLQKIATSSYHVFAETDESSTNFDVLKREFVYNSCDLDFID
ncbi:hypothetical protein CHS0354_022771 [Potamilus streckersoni]|uniref:COL6A n=1 Tax=Potamilus streckersoni TaxID=2493646 RepID=A0AAE0S1U3_9BIVA|nr:hypothetical protein CHS0354_022771 [Potamilus streckersoni]